jgi:rhodanese-related sulfurtransferase
MGSVPDRLDEIPSDRTVVCICRVGGRSGAVATALAGAGYDVRNLDGGMLAWEAAGLSGGRRSPVTVRPGHLSPRPTVADDRLPR